MKQLTKEGYEKLVQNRKELEKKRLRIVKRIEKAKELGDLSENIEYITARQDLNLLMSEIDNLEEILRNCIIVEHENKKNCVTLGSTVEVEYNSTKHTFTIVSFNESDPSSGKISNESPIGLALLGCCVGDITTIETPMGLAKCKILKIL